MDLLSKSLSGSSMQHILFLLYALYSWTACAWHSASWFLTYNLALHPIIMEGGTAMWATAHSYHGLSTNWRDLSVSIFHSEQVWNAFEDSIGNLTLNANVKVVKSMFRNSQSFINCWSVFGLYRFRGLCILFKYLWNCWLASIHS